MALMSAQHRLSKLLLQHGYVYDGDAWTRRHDAWLRRIRREQLLPSGSGTLSAFDDAYDAVTHTLARRDRLDTAIAALAADSEFTAVAHRLGCLRGISTTTAFALAVEVGDWHRLTGASIRSYLGFVPSEHSSGGSRSQGGITKTGNSHARRLLIEAAWHHKPRYAPGKTMRERWALAPAVAAARGDAGNRRLHHRWAVLSAHKKRHTVANTAIAREPPAGAGPWPSWTTNHTDPFTGPNPWCRQQREDRTSESTVSTPGNEGTLDLRHATTVQPKQGPAVPTRAYQTDRASPDTPPPTPPPRTTKRGPLRPERTPLHPAHLTGTPTYQSGVASVRIRGGGTISSRSRMLCWAGVGWVVCR